ncbi:putative short-chain dehydrogenase [Biscogniauxia mediterranea]|nr:putative short-chain dehydrogenase [Biscogniauxia mediterranea]
MPAFSGHVDFQPDKDIPSLEGKVILVTGGTAGLGKASIEALSRHGPAHIYFTGRNTKAAEALIARVKNINSQVALTFLETDFLSLASVKQACARFQHERLDIIMCNAGVIFKPPGLSQDGFKVTFAINHLAHAMIIQQLLPVMLKTAQIPGADVRLVSLTSAGWRGHPWDGISFSTLKTTQGGVLKGTVRYGQSKLANVMYAAELARRHPEIMAVSVHPGVVNTDLVSTLSPAGRALVYVSTWIQGDSVLEEEQGCFSQLWVAAGARRDELVNGGFYMPIGVLSNDKLDCTAKSEKLAGEIWKWTDEVLASF